MIPRKFKRARLGAPPQSESMDQWLEEGKALRFSIPDALLQQHSASTYNVPNLFYVWSYMDGYLDVESSAELGKFYVKNELFLIFYFSCHSYNT